MEVGLFSLSWIITEHPGAFFNYLDELCIVLSRLTKGLEQPSVIGAVDNVLGRHLKWYSKGPSVAQESCIWVLIRLHRILRELQVEHSISRLFRPQLWVYHMCVYHMCAFACLPL